MSFFKITRVYVCYLKCVHFICMWKLLSAVAMKDWDGSYLVSLRFHFYHRLLTFQTMLNKEAHSKSHNHLHTASMLCSSLYSPSIKTCCKLHLMPHFSAELCVSFSLGFHAPQTTWILLLHLDGCSVFYMTVKREKACLCWNILTL